MSRRTSARGYLQQLAKPIGPGETVLTARPGAAAFAAETGPQVPVIEDHFEMPARSAGAQDSARVRVDLPGMNQDSAETIEAVESAVGEDANARPPANIAARIAEAGPKVHATDARARRGGSLIAQPLAAVTSTVAADRREQTQARMSVSAGTEDNLVRARVESRLRTEQDSAAKQSVAGKKVANEQASQSARQDYLTDRTAIEPTTEAAFSTKVAQQKAKPEVQSQVAAGPRVRIGTVEIRMKLPQSPAPPPAAPVTSPAQNNAVMQARGRSGSAEPLTRGLEWSYGLVQG